MTGMEPRRIVVVVYPGIQSLDVAGPVEVFSTANREAGHAPGGRPRRPRQPSRELQFS